MAVHYVVCSPSGGMHGEDPAPPQTTKTLPSTSVSNVLFSKEDGNDYMLTKILDEIVRQDRDDEKRRMRGLPPAEAPEPDFEKICEFLLERHTVRQTEARLKARAEMVKRKIDEEQQRKTMITEQLVRTTPPVPPPFEESKRQEQFIQPQEMPRKRGRPRIIRNPDMMMAPKTPKIKIAEDSAKDGPSTRLRSQQRHN